MKYVLEGTSDGEVALRDIAIEASIDCEVNERYLSLYTWTVDNCAAAGEFCDAKLSLDIALEDSTLVNAHMPLYALEAEADLNEVKILVDVTAWNDDGRYAGTASFAMPYVEGTSGATKEQRVHVEFSCGDFRMHGCWGPTP